MLKQIDFTKLPITEIVNEIIYIAAQAGASDIHFDPTETTIRVRFRIDGVLIDYTIIPESIRKNLNPTFPEAKRFKMPLCECP